MKGYIMTGYIEAHSAAVQNSCCTSYRANINVGTSKFDIYLLTLIGLLRATSVDYIHWETDETGAVVGAMILGKGTYGKSGKPGVICNYNLHIYIESGVNMMLCEVWSEDSTTLLWATGPYWPIQEGVSEAVKCGGVFQLKSATAQS